MKIMPRNFIRLSSVLWLLLPAAVALADPPQSLTFTGQAPLDASVWTVPAQGTYGCSGNLSQMVVQWHEPAAGVTSQTGILVMLHGIDANSYCNRKFMEWGTPWADACDVIVCNVYYRNIPFYPPYDFGVYQVTDVVRGLGAVMDLYPQADTRRLYMIGSSGGGHLALQVLACTPGLWAEVYALSAITKITTSEDRQLHGYEHDPDPYGWNVNFCPPYRTSSLSAAQLRQLSAETNLRSPQWNFARIPGAAAIAPVVTLIHGTADMTTDYQHLLDMQQVIQADFRSPGEIVDHPGAVGVAVGHWTFWQVENGDHSYGGALPELSSRGDATRALCPAAFTSRLSAAPDPIADGGFPVADLWTYHFSGPLRSCSVSKVQESQVEDWMLFEATAVGR